MARHLLPASPPCVHHVPEQVFMMSPVCTPVRGSRGSQAVRRRLPRWGDAAGCGVGLPRSAGAAWAPTACLWPRTSGRAAPHWSVEPIEAADARRLRSLRQRPAAHRRAWIHPFVRDQHGGWRPLMHGAPYEVFAPGRSRDEPIDCYGPLALPASGLLGVHVVGQCVADSLLVEYRSLEQGSESGEIAVLSTSPKQPSQDVSIALLEPKSPDNSKGRIRRIH